MERLMRIIPLVLLCSYLIRAMVIGPQFVDAAILAVLMAFHAYMQTKEEKKSIQEVKKALEVLTIAVDEVKKREEELKTHVTGLRMSMSMRPQSNGQQRL